MEWDPDETAVISADWVREMVNVDLEWLDEAE